MKLTSLLLWAAPLGLAAGFTPNAPGQEGDAPAAATSARHVSFGIGKHENDVLLKVEAPDFAVSFRQLAAWTVGTFDFKGKRIGTPSGATGTVVQVYDPAKKKLDWLGTGHGGEVVQQVTLLLDGKEVPLVAEGKDVFSRAATHSGRRVELLKKSVLGPIRYEAHHVMPAGTSHYLSVFRGTVTEDLSAERFNQGHTFMHMMPCEMNEWIVFSEGGHVLKEGVVEEGSSVSPPGKTVLFKDLKAAACYSPAWKIGVAYVFPQAYPGESHLQSRPGKDLKFRAGLLGAAYSKAGSTFEFKLKVLPFEAAPADWKTRAKALAAETGF